MERSTNVLQAFAVSGRPQDSHVGGHHQTISTSVLSDSDRFCSESVNKQGMMAGNIFAVSDDAKDTGINRD